MAENSRIEWTDHTVNFWWGCAKVSPACANCYAEGQAARFYPGHWGPDAPRRLRVTQARNEAMAYERRAVKEHRRFRVFTNSMSDFFEDRRDLDQARLEALDVIRQTPRLDWLILTKRPEAIMRLLYRAEVDAPGSGLSDWLRDWLRGQAPANVWLGTTVEDQERAEQRIQALVKVPGLHFLSCEPLLGPVDLESFSVQAIHPDNEGYGVPAIKGVDWLICGGESGPHARPMHPDWARGLRDQCAAAGVPFLFKQWGEFVCALPEDNNPNNPGKNAVVMRRLGKKAAGRLLDGVEHNGYPQLENSSA